MNRAWIPAGALAGVSVAGLIALGPLTDSLSTPVTFATSVVHGASDAADSARAVPVSVNVRRRREHQDRGPSRAAARPRRRRRTATPGSSPKTGVTRHDSGGPDDPAARPRRQPPAKPKKPPKRPTSIGGTGGPNSDEGLASAASARRGVDRRAGRDARQRLPRRASERRPSASSARRLVRLGPRGYSSVGRAPGSHPGGQRFEPA